MILLRRFFDICLFKAGPANLPASQGLLKLVCLFYFVIGTLVSHIDYPWVAALMVNLSDLVLLLAVCWLLLSFRGFVERFLQMATAMVGTGAIVGLFGLPVLLLFRLQESQGQSAGLVFLPVLLLMFWGLFIIAHIFRHALDIRPSMAAILTVAYTIVSLIVKGLMMSGVA